MIQRKFGLITFIRPDLAYIVICLWEKTVFIVGCISKRACVNKLSNQNIVKPTFMNFRGMYMPGTITESRTTICAALCSVFIISLEAIFFDMHRRAVLLLFPLKRNKTKQNKTKQTKTTTRTTTRTTTKTRKATSGAFSYSLLPTYDFFCDSTGSFSLDSLV